MGNIASFFTKQSGDEKEEESKEDIVKDEESVPIKEGLHSSNRYDTTC